MAKERSVSAATLTLEVAVVPDLFAPTSVAPGLPVPYPFILPVSCNVPNGLLDLDVDIRLTSLLEQLLVLVDLRVQEGLEVWHLLSRRSFGSPRWGLRCLRLIWTLLSHVACLLAVGEEHDDVFPKSQCR